MKTPKFLKLLARFSVLLASLAIFTVIITTGSFSKSSTSTKRAAASVAAPTAARQPALPARAGKIHKSSASFLTHGLTLPSLLPASLLSPLPPPPPPLESIATYAAPGCTVPKTDFNFGEDVCVVVANAPLGANERLIWGHTDGRLARETFINSATISDTLTITPTTVIAGQTLDNKGTWRVESVDTDFAPVAVSYFTIHDPATPTSDLSVYKFPKGPASQVIENTNVSFVVSVSNQGPDTATNVHLADAVPGGTSFGSLTPDAGGPTSTCVDSDCIIPSLARGVRANFTAVYHANGVASNTLTTYSATVSSDPPPTPGTTELRPVDNSVSGDLTILATSTTPETCTLTCPINKTVTANATQAGQAGAFVTYSAASVLGDCGAVSNSPVSGSFFTVTGSPHTVTSSSNNPGPDGVLGTGDDVPGPSCTFTVTVLDSAPPTISCPANITVTAPAGSSEATLPIPPGTGTPATTPSDGVTVVGVRSDGTPATFNDDGTVATPAVIVPLTDPYPVGATGILWTATDETGRKASCKQTINVNALCGTDTQNPTIEAPASITVTTGPDNTGCTVALDDELGLATARDNCTVTVTIAGIPPGNEFPIGTTHLIYTATDGAGHTATDTQDVTVIDDTPPSIVAPADATYVCPSQVPTASASQAIRGEVRDEDGNLLPPGPPFDNCGTPAVSVTETNNGGVGSAANPLVIKRTFTAMDSHGNSSSAVQTITVADGVAPTISAPADASYQCASEVPAASASQATASDNCAAPTVAVSQTTNGGAGSTASPLVITRTYTATDAAGNAASASQTITVIDTTAPTIALTGANPQYVECHTSYPELGATANDNCDSSFAATPSGTVSVNTVGTYTITYNATDAAGNAATPVTRTVIVRDTIAPTITLTGANPQYVECHTSYPELGATASDSCTGDFAATPSGTVSVNTVGTYTITYNATDASGNAATPVTRTVIVRDTIAPTLTLNSYAPSMWPPNHKYSTFQVTQFVTAVTDSCDTPLGVSSVVMEKVTSDEIENGNGDGNTMNDIIIAPDCKSVQLRSEREGNSNGRVYTITFRVRDASGNTTRATAKVVVPHNPGETVVDSGVHYTVNGSCP